MSRATPTESPVTGIATGYPSLKTVSRRNDRVPVAGAWQCCRNVSSEGVAVEFSKSVVTWRWHDGRWKPASGRPPAERGADVTTTIAASPLTATDRCDRCGAQAYVRATMESGFDLLLCGHHFHENEARLRETAKSIHDETERLEVVPATAPVDER